MNLASKKICQTRTIFNIFSAKYIMSSGPFYFFCGGNLPLLIVMDIFSLKSYRYIRDIFLAFAFWNMENIIKSCVSSPQSLYSVLAIKLLVSAATTHERTNIVRGDQLRKLIARHTDLDKVWLQRELIYQIQKVGKHLSFRE